MSWAIGATLRRRVGALANGTEVWIKAWSEDDPDRVEVAPCWGWKRPVWCDLADLEAFAVACMEQAAIEARQSLAATGHGRIPRRRGA